MVMMAPLSDLKLSCRPCRRPRLLWGLPCKYSGRGGVWKKDTVCVKQVISSNLRGCPTVKPPCWSLNVIAYRRWSAWAGGRGVGGHPISLFPLRFGIVALGGMQGWHSTLAPIIQTNPLTWYQTPLLKRVFILLQDFAMETTLIYSP